MSNDSKALIRIDQWLANQGLANSRTHAASLIELGQVEMQPSLDSVWKIVSKPSFKIDVNFPRAQLRVLEGPANRYVSRGGLKLEGALNQLDLTITGIRILDVGVSTGGFSDCCLQRGAREVIGVDVGHGQISESLLSKPHFCHFEGINARRLLDYQKEIPALTSKFDLIVGDLSFISLTAILPQLGPLLGDQGKILFLVKPQFELDATCLNKSGLVKNSKYYEDVQTKIVECAIESGFEIIKYFDSQIHGKDGNKEFFLFAEIKAGKFNRP